MEGVRAIAIPTTFCSLSPISHNVLHWPKPCRHHKAREHINISHVNQPPGTQSRVKQGGVMGIIITEKDAKMGSP
jgi:hypothetical protein